MDQLKVIRTVCLFTDSPSKEALAKLEHLSYALSSRGISVQTQRMCSSDVSGIFEFDRRTDKPVLYSIGRQTYDSAKSILPEFLTARTVNFNIDLAGEQIGIRHTDLLSRIIRENAGKTFNFAYTFNNAASTPFFPSASYDTNGFTVGLQATDLSECCNSIQEWLDRMKTVWSEVYTICSSEEGFLGIDTSIAPLFAGRGSFIDFIKRTGRDFSRSVTTDVYLSITRFINEACPKKVGLCGLMFPCLEDFELAVEYEQGNFPIERNAFLSLHSGLGIDSYPIGIDERPERIAEVLTLIQGLSNKYGKPLSARFVSDGKASIGQLTHFGNPYLKDVVIRPLCHKKLKARFLSNVLQDIPFTAAGALRWTLLLAQVGRSYVIELKHTKSDPSCIKRQPTCFKYTSFTCNSDISRSVNHQHIHPEGVVFD